MASARHLILGLLLVARAVNSADAAETATLAPREITPVVDGRSLKLTFVIFSPHQYSLRVIDNRAANDTGRFPRLRMAMKSLDAAAGCNGGFFEQHPFGPFGLMIADGVHAGAFDPQSWMKGLIVVRDGELRFEAAETFQDVPGVSHALQAGPWLVREGKPAANSDARRAKRTFVCRDNTGQWALGVSDPCTLGQLAAALGSDDVASALAVQDALNLDGGPSTGLWVRGDSEPYSLPEQWTVQNYVGLFPKADSHTP